MPNRRYRAAAVVGSLVSSVALLTWGAGQASAAPVPEIAPYFETTGAHTSNLSTAISSHGLKMFTAAFVLGKACTPTWDDHTPLAQGGSRNTLVSSAQSQGATAIISFGGQQGTELATSCTSLSKLTTAYKGVITRFGVRKVDFDIEGKGPLNNTAVNTRRFNAIKALEKQIPNLEVSVTIPVGHQGIETNDPTVGDGIKFLKLAKSTGARIDVVNLMTMDYGDNVSDMGAAATSSAQHALTQLKTIWSSFTYHNIGITPMIGQNDSPGEVFTWDNSQRVLNFAEANGVRRLAFWSLNRDVQCGSGDSPPNTCSGLTQDPLTYTDGFLDH